MTGDNLVNYSSISLNDLTDAVVEVLCRKEYKEVATFDEIVEYAVEAKRKNHRISAFIISVKRNYDSRNDNDKLIIIQGLLDSNNKPISHNGIEAESRIIHARTIDKKFIDVLNGEETKIVRF